MSLRTRTYTGALTDEVSAPEIEHSILARTAAAEGIVLLENRGNILPIAKGSSIALYGAGAEITVKGGTGSGDVNARTTVSIRQGLENAGYRLTSEAWLDRFRELYTKERFAWRDYVLAEMKTPKYSHNSFYAYSDNPFQIPAGDLPELAEASSDGADIAIFVLSRKAGEAADRKEEAGDYYMTEQESALLTRISQAYQDVILVLNTGGLIDLEFADKLPNISAIIYMVQGGQESGNALADVISGAVVPSGKLTDTWARKYTDYPNAEFFGSRYQDAWKAEYREDIYVGYRYFDTFEIPVRYGFGYGLSYTTFELRSSAVQVCADTVSVDAAVKNTGSVYAGKEVVQLYVSCPQEKLPKEFRRLCCFGKTNLLQPGEAQNMRLSFHAREMASFDEASSSWMLFGGTYGVWIGSSLQNAELIGKILVERDTVMEKCDHICLQREEIPLLRPNMERMAVRQAQWQEKSVPEVRLPGLTGHTINYDIPEPDAQDPAWKIVLSLNDDQLIAMSTGRMRQGTGELGSAGWTVPGAAAETERILAQEPWNVASIVLADGPAGLRLKRQYQVVQGELDAGTFLEGIENGFLAEKREIQGTQYYQNCTAIPVGTLLAQSWNVSLMQQVGEMIGREMKAFEVTLWLAPGMNIHRNPLCGRNFEYYSEDPLLSGVMAAAMTRGVQSIPGCGTTIKHFACNNQEDKRKGSDSILSERALRELYLKGFEIAVKTSQPMAIMTSYNMVNGVHAANSYDLCTKAARAEWGFEGLVMTDWTTTSSSTAGTCTAPGCIRAGNDLIMPGVPSDHTDLRGALEDGSLDRDALRQCVYNIVRISLLSNQYTDAKSYDGLYENLPYIMKAE